MLFSQRGQLRCLPLHPGLSGRGADGERQDGGVLLPGRQEGSWSQSVAREPGGEDRLAGRQTGWVHLRTAAAASCDWIAQ